MIVVWAVDRICREGIEELLKLIRELRERHATLVSIQEPWLNGSDATTELLAGIAAWVAHQESARCSERIKLGLARRRAEGKPVGSRERRIARSGAPRATTRPGSAAAPRAKTLTFGHLVIGTPDVRASRHPLFGLTSVTQLTLAPSAHVNCWPTNWPWPQFSRACSSAFVGSCESSSQRSAASTGTIAAIPSIPAQIQVTRSSGCW